MRDPALHVLRRIRSRELENYRDVVIALPPSYEEEDRRYPVVVMQDGQNLFDDETSFAGAWGLLPALRELAAAGVPTVVVGVANMGVFRRFEYSPFVDPEHGGGDGDRYLDFLTGTVLPRVRREFRIGEGPEQTCIAGSSLGGLLSAWALWKRPDVFGAAAALSPAVWFAAEAFLELVGRSPLPPGRLYLDVGTGESDRLVASVRRLRDLLVAGGMPAERFRYREDAEGQHHEAHWGRRFRDALPFLLDSMGAPSA